MLIISFPVIFVIGTTQFSNTHVNPKHGEHLWFLWVKKIQMPYVFLFYHKAWAKGGESHGESQIWTAHVDA